MNLENVVPKCVPSRDYAEKGYLSDRYGSVLVCYDDGTGLVKEEELHGMNPLAVKSTAWNNLQTKGITMTDIYRDHGVKVVKPPVYSVRTPFAFHIQSLSWIARLWNEEVFYILPATADETLLVAGSEISSGRVTEDSLREMARRANNNLKADHVTEILTEDIYCYENAKGKLRRLYNKEEGLR